MPKKRTQLPRTSYQSAMWRPPLTPEDQRTIAQIVGDVECAQQKESFFHAIHEAVGAYRYWWLRQHLNPPPSEVRDALSMIRQLSRQLADYLGDVADESGGSLGLIRHISRHELGWQGSGKDALLESTRTRLRTISTAALLAKKKIVPTRGRPKFEPEQIHLGINLADALSRIGIEPTATHQDSKPASPYLLLLEWAMNWAARKTKAKGGAITGDVINVGRKALRSWKQIRSTKK